MAAEKPRIEVHPLGIGDREPPARLDVYKRQAIPLWLGVLAGILVACLCGAFNGFLVAGPKIQPMVCLLYTSRCV